MFRYEKDEDLDVEERFGSVVACGSAYPEGVEGMVVAAAAARHRRSPEGRYDSREKWAGRIRVDFQADGS